MAALSSKWGNLSEHLIASFYEVDNDGIPKGKAIVQAPLTESNMEITLNWQSPFENAGTESKAPAMAALLQSGSIMPLYEEAKSLVTGEVDTAASIKQRNEEKSFLEQFSGRTGMTKLNSMQVFTGMPPIKISVTALFRAWDNPYSEVEEPFNQLVKWSLPVDISKDGTALVSGARFIKGDVGYVEALMPSKAPVKIGMRYKGRTYAPLVIESISNPISSPIDAEGRHTELLVQMTLCTLTALDQSDWAASKK